MNVRALALDFGDTLAAPGPDPDGHTVLAVLRRRPDTHVPDAFVAAYDHVHRVTRAGDRVHDTHTPFADELRHAAELCGADIPDPDAVAEAVFEDIPDSRVMPRAAQALLRIRERDPGLTCVLACDTQRPEPVRRRTLAEAGIAACFDAVVLSCAIGLRKPHPGFYAEVERRCAVAREEILFVGNTPGKDATGPHVYGMRAVLIAPAGRPDGLHEQIGVIDHFADLPAHLERLAHLERVEPPARRT